MPRSTLALVMAFLSFSAAAHGEPRAGVRVVVANSAELVHALLMRASEIELSAGEYDLSRLTKTIRIDHDTKMRGAPGGATVLRGFNVKGASLFALGDAARLAWKDIAFRDCSALAEVTSEGKPLVIECRRVATFNCGPLLRTAGEAFDGMRDVEVLLQDCELDGGHKSKGVSLISVGVKRFTAERCCFTRFEKAALQIGEADLFQPRRGPITIRDCRFHDTLDRAHQPGESHAIFLLACQDVLIDNCRISEVNSREGRTLDTEGIYTKARNLTMRDLWLHNAGRAAITVKGVGEEPVEDPLHVRFGDNVFLSDIHVTADEEYARVGITEGVYIDCTGKVTVRGLTSEGPAIHVRVQQRGAGDITITDCDLRGGEKGVYYREVQGDVYAARNRIRGCLEPHAGRNKHKAVINEDNVAKP